MSIHPKDKVFFCSAASRYAKEMLAGSASNYQSFIFIEYCKPFPYKINQAGFDEAWLHGLNVLAKARKGKVVLIRNKNTTKGTVRIIFADLLKKCYASFITDIENYTSVKLAERISDSNTKWHTAPFLIVCTNGKKDKCCSKFGFPVYKFLEGIFPRGDVWECTHIGGDRFAANVIYLPYGIYYGRVAIEDLPDIVDACEREEIYLPNYRGLCTLSFLNQTIEYYLRLHLKNSSIHFPLEFLYKEQVDNEIAVTARIGHNTYKVHVTRQVILYPHLLTCTSRKRENVVKYLQNRIEELAG